MHKDAEKLVELLFDEDEEICVSIDKYAYRSVSQNDIRMGSFELISNDGSKRNFVSPSSISLLSVNPIKGERNDENCTALRTFMVELDDMGLKDQYAYVKDMKMPYSACVFSGGKSLHYAITLTTPLPSIDIYKFLAEWILKVMGKADQATKNPSRGIRFPGTIRDGKEQKLLEIRSRIDLEVLQSWLNEYPALKPEFTKKEFSAPQEADLVLLPKWVQEELSLGIDSSKGRNNRWFAIAYECSLKGFSEDDTIALLGNFFSEDRDFKRREWLTTVKSGIKKAERIRNG